MEKIEERGLSRFIKLDDEKTNDFVYNISNEWWSRLYEYPWAGSFAEENDVCLDAACGVGHHLKYYLAEKCKEVYACDLDSFLNDRVGMLESIKTSFGIEAYNRVMKNAHKIEFKVENLINLSYENKKFDKIYCISVLEHMSEEERKLALMEFNRCLKEEGIIVITMDYPSVELENFKKSVEDSGLKFKYGYDFSEPENILVSTLYPGLKCFRSILSKK
ncbi:MAG: class I SAM-dependent methyltransferase [Clostridium sp.]|uniref:class I SAM-dependent methyltransferase n=1 Tax=Clostridium sp. TaxID=1506 RepID=UPI003F34BE3C